MSAIRCIWRPSVRCRAGSETRAQQSIWRPSVRCRAGSETRAQQPKGFRRSEPNVDSLGAGLPTPPRV